MKYYMRNYYQHPVTNNNPLYIMNQMKQTKQTQTNNKANKSTELGKWNPDNIDSAKLYDEWNNSWELYKPMRTLNNYQ